MKSYTRDASVSWLGTYAHGKGAITTANATLNEIPYLSAQKGKRRGTTSIELMAAAHAGSFSTCLAHELGIAGFNPRKIATTATITMQAINTGWRMTQIDLDVVVSVPRIRQCDFIDAALRAKANCPISQLVSANISMRAKLDPRDRAARLFPHRDLDRVPRLAIPGEKTRTRRHQN